MFEQTKTAPPDPILGLTEAFNRDPNPDKINLSVGVYQDDSGATPVLATVHEAERRLLEGEQTKSYKPITGDPLYGRFVRELLFGTGAALVDDGRAVTAHCPGGTGALRVAGSFLAALAPSTRIWLSDPTWANHEGVFAAAGMRTATYAYFDASSSGLDFEAMMSSLASVEAGDAVLLHACCHNPTGVDPSVEQWRRIGALLAERGALAVVDFAYQGFAKGVDEDAAGLRALMAEVDEAVVCSSFSKNFGLYNERTGAATFVAATADAAAAVASQVKTCIRTNYSNPPAHGGAIVATILGDSELRARWHEEVRAMRERIHTMRRLFVETLAAKGAPGDYSFISRQNGMFSFSGLTRQQVEALRERYGIYIVGSGRINVAGMTSANMDRLCTAIAAVVNAS
jgi:aspartate/tyrosine/aromatic aminotransferase